MKSFQHAFGCAFAAMLLGLTFAAGPAPAQQVAPRATPAGPGNAANGKKAFIAHSCYSCHGRSAEGGVGARLVGYPDTVQAFAAYVRQPKGVMPPASATITATEMNDIYAWVRSIPPSPDAKTLDLLKP